MVSAVLNNECAERTSGCTGSVEYPRFVSSREELDPNEGGTLNPVEGDAPRAPQSEPIDEIGLLGAGLESMGIL